jgi:hypothetical protein
MKIFATFDADMSPVEILQGLSFVTAWQFSDDDAGYVAAGISHSPVALELYGPADLGRHRIFALEIRTPPADHFVSSWSLAVEDGVIVLNATFEAASPPARRTIPKSLVQARLIDTGKMDAVFAALLSSPANFAKWFAPDWPNVFADDAAMLAVLTAVGADIETITAP